MAVVDRGSRPLKRTDVLRSRRRIYWRAREGTLYASGWPRARGKPKSALQQAWVDQFSSLARLTPSIHPIERNNADEWLKGTLWYWRDVLHSAAIGKLIMDEGAVRITTPTASVFRSTLETMPNNVSTWLTPSHKNWDNYTWWDGAVNPTRLTAKAAGLYICGGRVETTPTRTGFKRFSIWKNRSSFVTHFNMTDAVADAPNWDIMGIVYMLPGDYVEAAYHVVATGFQVRLADFWIVAITPEGIQ